MSWLNKLAERQIAAARARGELTGLKGEGQPLADHTACAFTSPGEAIGFRIMAEAGVLPTEITLKKQALALRAHLTTLTDPAQQKACMTELASLEMRQAIAEEARRKFMR